MTIPAGTALGPYEILALIGSGGMGEVYRARDSKLKRDVALKVLPEVLAGDPERIARLQREAEVLATLTHQNIAAIYGVEDASSGRALVMEMAEGETLAQRIGRGPLPLDEALPIARQIADALEYAHDHGVLHRDLKPANIKVAEDGNVKILDFGLAKAVAGPASNSSAGAADPTITSPAFTQAGVILGTAAYMAPEQARGRTLDRRADIWAFGCVLYEMLTGRRLFDAETVPDTLAAVLTKEVAFDRLPAGTPEQITQLLRRALTRDPRTRLQSIGEARIAIDNATGAPTAARDHPPARSGSLLPWAVAAVAVVLSAIAAYSAKAPADPMTTQRVMFQIPLPAGFSPNQTARPALSPDRATTSTSESGSC